MTSQGAGPALKADRRIEAERACGLSDKVRIARLQSTDIPCEGLTEIHHQDYAVYRYLEFDNDINNFEIKITGQSTEATVEIILDSLEGVKIGTCYINENPGTFCRETVTSGRLLEKIQRQVARWAKDKNVGAFANVGLISAPDFMRDVDFEPSVDPDEAKSGTWKRLAPPKDPVEWGRWVGHIVRSINVATHGIIKWVYIWNEPNAGNYLPVPWPEKPGRYRFWNA